MHVQVHPEHVFNEKKRSERSKKKTENWRIERKRQQARDEGELKKT
jgi:hypothetical protein